MGPEITSVSLRLAFAKLVEITSSASARLIRVTVVPCGVDRKYAVSIPPEYTAKIYDYLAQHSDLPVPAEGHSLILTRDQAALVVSLAYQATKGDELGSAGLLPSNATGGS